MMAGQPSQYKAFIDELSQLDVAERWLADQKYLRLGDQLIALLESMAVFNQVYALWRSRNQ